jgi:hypothetical protein
MDKVFVYLFQFILKIDLQLSLIIYSFLQFITKIQLFINVFKVLYRQV